MAKRVKHEKFLIAFAKYRLLLLKVKDFDESYEGNQKVDKEDLEYVKANVKEISKMSGYDFEKPLVRKIERIKDYFRDVYGIKF